MFNPQPRWQTWPYSNQTRIHEYTARHWCTQKNQQCKSANLLKTWAMKLPRLSPLRNTFYYCIKCLIQLQNSGEQCSSRWPSFLREAFTAVSCIAYSIVRNRSLYVQAWIQKLLGVNQYTEMSVGSGFCLHQYRHID